jgi:hypothetical protein
MIQFFIQFPGFGPEIKIESDPDYEINDQERKDGDHSCGHLKWYPSDAEADDEIKQRDRDEM